MRRAGWVIVFCAAVVGCIHQTDRPTAATVARSLAPAAPVEGICLQTVLLERPVGDQFLDRDLWNATRPIGSQETRVLLSENGLRAGILAGSLPQQFQKLLESEIEAINPRELTFAMRTEEVLPTAGPHEKCEFNLLTDLAGKRAPVAFKQARAGILVRPEPTSDDRVRIWCEPRIQHGERREWLRPTADGTGFVKYEEVPLASYPELAFETPLGRGECLIVGWHAEQHDAIGSAIFGVDANGEPRQRVLVIRAWQVNPGKSSDLPSLGPSRRPSIAAEVSRSTR